MIVKGHEGYVICQHSI